MSYVTLVGAMDVLMRCILADCGKRKKFAKFKVLLIKAHKELLRVKL